MKGYPNLGRIASKVGLLVVAALACAPVVPPSVRVGPTPDIEGTIQARVAATVAAIVATTPVPTPTSEPTAVFFSTATPTPTSAPTFASTPLATPTATSALPTLGHSRTNPAGIGIELSSALEDTQTLIEGFEGRVTLLEVIRGEEAAKLVDIASFLLEALNPPPGDEWLLAKVRFELLKAPDADTPYGVISFQFDSISAEGKVHGEGLSFLNIHFKDERPRMGPTLYEGASHEGWLAFHVSQRDTKPLMRFNPGGYTLSALWWKLYE